MAEKSDTEAIFRNLHNYGLRRQDIEFCGVYILEGRVVYYRKRTAGPNMTAFTARPISACWVCRDALIGFLYPDGTLRTDAEMLCIGGGKIELPRFVLFYRDHIPMNARPRLADLQYRRVQKPTEVVL